jgi:hypothetical protein
VAAATEVQYPRFHPLGWALKPGETREPALTHHSPDSPTTLPPDKQTSHHHLLLAAATLDEPLHHCRRISDLTRLSPSSTPATSVRSRLRAAVAFCGPHERQHARTGTPPFVYSTRPVLDTQSILTIGSRDST